MLRDPQYSNDLQREYLAGIILHDLLILPILDSETEITQGIGGSFPRNLKPKIANKSDSVPLQSIVIYVLEGDIMLFFCFSSKDRHPIVESILFHLTNYGLPVWYDRHKMLLGDERDYKNFDEGVNSCNYAIIILSKNTIKSTCANEEIDLIYEKFKRRQMYVFPLFFNIKASDLPKKYTWMTKLVYKELTIGNDSRSACNHIICRILLDEIQKYKIKNINEFLKMYENNRSFSYLTKLINSYCRISDDNHNAQIALLYAGCLYIKENYNLTDIPPFYYKGTQRLFEETRLNLPIDLRETLIFERLFLLLFNAAIFGYII